MHSLVLPLRYLIFYCNIFFNDIFVQVPFFSLQFQPLECIFLLQFYVMSDWVEIVNEMMKTNKLIACFALINLNGSISLRIYFAHCSTKRLSRQLSKKLPFVYFVCDICWGHFIQDIYKKNVAFSYVRAHWHIEPKNV